MFKTILTIGLLISITGCAPLTKVVYEGERLSADQESTLSVPEEYKPIGFHPHMYITSIDKKSIGDPFLELIKGNAYPNLVYLKPGRHTIGISFQEGMRKANARVWFDAEPGQFYKANGYSEGDRAIIFITNNAGERIGGAGEAPPN